MEITPSYETCQKLKQAGFPQDCEFYYYADGDNTFVDFHIFGLLPEQYLCAAPTAAEIADRLPDRIEKDGEIYLLTIVKHGDKHYTCGYYNWVFEKYLHGTSFGNENTAEAKSQLYMWCKERGYV